MVRVLLTLVLMGLVALPHGLCFCHYVETSPPRVEPMCCDMEAPAAPADDEEDHDADCSCKLRESLAAGPAPVDVEHGDFASFVTSSPPIAAAMTTIHDHIVDPFKTGDAPLALIPCALRI